MTKSTEQLMIEANDKVRELEAKLERHSKLVKEGFVNSLGALNLRQRQFIAGVVQEMVYDGDQEARAQVGQNKHYYEPYE